MALIPGTFSVLSSTSLADLKRQYVLFHWHRIQAEVVGLTNQKRELGKRLGVSLKTVYNLLEHYAEGV